MPSKNEEVGGFCFQIGGSTKESGELDVIKN
jgi:hypothetical protein